MVGYTGDELRSLGPLDITHEDDREAAREMIENVQSGKREDYQTEKRYRRKDGKVIWVRVSTARALDPESPLPGIPAIIENITEHKRAENDLHNAREALSRATRLTIMGELAASIAHEINQPLGAIIMNGNACRRFLAVSPPDIDEVKDGLDAIVSDGNRASDVLSRIRAMLKNAAPERSHMPGMNGLELQEHLVASSYSIPVIFITAFTDDRTRVQALKAGAVGYLAKPFADEDLLNCIHAALKLPVPSTLQPRGQ
jgi:PAS domain S-box-containing protein